MSEGNGVSDVRWPTVTIPKFDEMAYLCTNEDARDAVASGESARGFDHYLRTGVEENRTPVLRREPMALQGGVEKFFISETGYFLILGWLADEGGDAPSFKLIGSDFTVEVPLDSVLRHARADIEAHIREGAYDYGFIAFGRTPPRSILKQSVLVQVNSPTGAFQARATPDIVADKRVLDTLLILTTTIQSHAGREANLYAFLGSAAGNTTVELFRRHVDRGMAGHHVERFRSRPVSRSFVTVLFGSTEAIMLQPVLFRQQGIDFGEWIYVCNSPEDASTVLRLSRLVSDLYDVMITAIIMTDNVGFGAANNVAIGHAASENIYIINPDVFPLPGHTAAVRDALENRDLGDKLWGGLLFYDEHNLMHSGMFVERDLYFRCHTMNRFAAGAAPTSFGLMRVEHFDKGVPFDEKRWREPLVVPAITGALMVFSRRYFERIGGFSTRYIYGHYEDADLSLRWAAEHGPVVIDPQLRLVHLEGQGSRARGEQYRGAATVNRYLFALQHEVTYLARTEALSQSRRLNAAECDKS